MKELCNKTMSFQDCELAILRANVEKADKIKGNATVSSPEVKKMVKILEIFLEKKKLICYGGTAINALLPLKDKFYNPNTDLPDFDFFSPNALNDAKELANIYYNEGFQEVEAKIGKHNGTYKVFVNFIGIADITYIHKDIFNALKRDAVKISGILYCPPNYLRMGMYLELSRPDGDISRWEKVLKRLTLFNNNYPLHSENCNTLDFQRNMVDNSKEDKIYNTLKDVFIQQGCVFFGGYAAALFSKYMPKSLQKKIKKIADFDVITEDPETCILVIKERLNDEGIKNIKIIKRAPIGELIAEHYQIKVGNDTVAFIYRPVSCHSYNEIIIEGKPVKIATIETIMSFYLAFLYSNRDYYDTERIVCMAEYLFNVQKQNRLKQSGLLKRFSITCYGHQITKEEMLAEKAEKYKELKNLKDKNKMEEFFLRYRPDERVEKIGRKKDMNDIEKEIDNIEKKNK